MNRTDGFVIKRINGVPYLLPFGQRIAEQRRGMRLNESGAYIWNALPAARDREHLLSLLAEQYEALPRELPELKRDMDNFLDTLLVWGLLPENEPLQTVCRALCIGGLDVRLITPPELEIPQFARFQSPNNNPEVPISELNKPSSHSDIPGSQPDMTIEVIPQTGLPKAETDARLLLLTKELLIAEQADSYRIFYPLSDGIRECLLEKDGSSLRIYAAPPFREPLTTELFHAMRLGFLLRAQALGRIAIHSASIEYRDRAWLFAGSSGTGKSTHTALWENEFHTPVINGDLNLIGLSDGTPMVYGIPWCGTSGIACTDALPLGGVVHLKQAAANECLELTKEKSALYLFHRAVSPSWTPGLMERNLELAEEVAGRIYSSQLLCTPAAEASALMKRQIDGYLSHVCAIN